MNTTKIVLSLPKIHMYPKHCLVTAVHHPLGVSFCSQCSPFCECNTHGPSETSCHMHTGTALQSHGHSTGDSVGYVWQMHHDTA